jgi:hypothetical protein
MLAHCNAAQSLVMQSRCAMRFIIAILTFVALSGVIIPGKAYSAPAAEKLRPTEAKAATPSTDAATEPVQVFIGTYLRNITDINFRINKASVDFYVWFRWKGDELNPHETFEVVNGESVESEVQEVRKIGDVNYAYARVHAILTVSWDMRRFALDEQSIPIIIEDRDAEINKLVYVVDKENIGVRDTIWLPGYVLAGSLGRSSMFTYKSNFGDPTLASGIETQYSRYTHEAKIQRPGFGYFFKVFVNMLLSTLVVSVAFMIDPEKISERLGVGVGALFAVVAANYVIAAQLPDTDTVTLADKVTFASMTMIMVSLILAVLSWRIHFEGKPQAWCKIIDRIGLFVVPGAYFLFVFSFLLDGIGSDPVPLLTS